MDLRISDAVFEKFPGFVAGVLVVHGLDNTAIKPELAAALSTVEQSVKEVFPTSETVGQHPHIKAWREAYKAFGIDPHKYRCSSEALVRQVLKGNSIWGINPLVDIYNYISLKYVLPVGGEDLKKVQGSVQLDFADGTENFTRLGGTENEPPATGEVIYKDDAGTICRMWNWREGERTKLTHETTDAIVVVDAMAPATADVVRETLEEMAALIKRQSPDANVTTQVVRR